MGVGKNIKRIAKEKGLTLVELSNKSGVPLNTIYTLTRADPESATVRTLSRLAEALDIDINMLRSSPEDYKALTGNPLPREPYSPIELCTLRKYKSLTPEQKDRVLDIMNSVMDLINKKDEQST